MGITNDLERLAGLHRSGALSDAEFASAKALALASRPHAAPTASSTACMRFAAVAATAGSAACAAAWRRRPGCPLGCGG